MDGDERQAVPGVPNFAAAAGHGVEIDWGIAGGRTLASFRDGHLVPHKTVRHIYPELRSSAAGREGGDADGNQPAIHFGGQVFPPMSVAAWKGAAGRLLFINASKPESDHRLTFETS